MMTAATSRPTGRPNRSAGGITGSAMCLCMTSIALRPVKTSSPVRRKYPTAPSGIDITTGVNVFRIDDRFRRHIDRCAGDCVSVADCLIRIQVLDEAEVEDLDYIRETTASAKDDIRWFDVTVYEPGFMCFTQRPADLLEHGNDAPG